MIVFCTFKKKKELIALFQIYIHCQHFNTLKYSEIKVQKKKIKKKMQVSIL